MKRFLAILLAVASVLTFNVTSYANEIYTDVNDASLDEATDFLYNFEIMLGYDDDTFLPDNTLTRAELAVCIARMLGLDEQDESDKSYFLDMPADHWAAGSVAQLVQRGFFSGYDTGYFGTNDKVKTVDALVVLTTMLGYGDAAKMSGGYPDGYMNVARIAGIMDGVPVAEMLSRGSAAKLFFNTMNAKVAITDFNGDVTVPGNDDETFLEYYRNIISVEGTVTEVPNTSMYAVGTYKNVMGVDNYTYDTADGLKVDNSVLGKYVTAYCRETVNDEYELIYYYVHENKTEEISVMAEDIVKADITDSSFVYTLDGKKKDIDIPNNATVIYNGVYVPTYTADTFKIDNGEIRFLRTKGSDGYNLIFVDDVDTIIVSGVEENNETIYVKGSQVLKFSDYEKVIIKNLDGEILDLSQIKPDMVLSVKRAAPRLLEIVICSNVITGTIEAIDRDEDEEIVTIDGTVYYITNEYKTDFLSQFSLNLNVTAYLDMYGKIAYCEKAQRVDSDLLGYLINAKYSESDEQLFFKIYTQDGELKRFETAEKVRIDGKTHKERETAYNVFYATAGNKPQLVVYRINDDEKITYIDTLYQNTAAGENDYNLSVNLSWDSYYLRQTGTIGRMGIFASNAVIFGVPSAAELPTANEEDFQIYTTKALCNYAYHELETYKLSPSTAYETIAVTEIKETEIKHGTHSYVLSKIVQTINEDDEPVWKLQMYGSSGALTMNTEAGYDISSLNLTRGDIITFAKNSKENIIKIEVRHSATKVYPSDTGNEKGGGESHRVYGRVAAKNEDMVKISYTMPTNTRNPEWNVAARVSKAVIYDKNNDEIYIGDINDVRSYEDSGNRCSEIIAEYGWDGVENVIIINQ